MDLLRLNSCRRGPIGTDMTTRTELTSPLENRKYKICYFCAEDLNGNKNYLDCGHPFCSKCLSYLKNDDNLCNNNSNNDDSADNYQRLLKLFRIARAATKPNGLNKTRFNSPDLSRKQPESQVTYSLPHPLKGTLTSAYDESQELIKCLVCHKLSYPMCHSPKETRAGDCESTNDLAPMERVVLHCDCCSHKGRSHDDQAVEAEFFCQKCSLNFCHKCRSVHDETPLFSEHPVLPISGKSCGMEQLCRRHSNLMCCYFCINCKLPLCSLCVLFHNRSDIRNDERSRPKSSHELHSQQHKTSEPHRLHERQPCLSPEQRPPERRLETRELENYTLLRSVVSDNTFQCNPSNSNNNNEGHKIVKFREALTLVREELKSSLNQLGPRLDALKEKLRSFCFLSDIPNPSDAACSSSSSSSTLSPPVESEQAGLKKQNSFKKRHFSTGEKNVKVRLLRPKTSSEKDKEPEVRLGRFRLSRSKKSSVANSGCHNNPTTPIKIELTSLNEAYSDGSDENTWSSDTSNNRLKLFHNFRKKFQTNTCKSSPINPEHRKQNESEAPSTPVLSTSTPVSGVKKVWRKLSASSVVCHETRVRIDSMSEQEKEFIDSAKMLISKYLKMFEVATKALESSQSKKLYNFYDNLSNRIKIILDHELSLLEPEISKRTMQRRERLRIIGNRSSENLKRLACRQESGVATLAITSAGLFESLSGLTMTNSSQKSKCSHEEPAEIWSSGRTILARPFQRWKYERTKTDLENSSVPCAAILVDEGRIAVVAEYDNNSIRNNRLQLLDGSNGSYLESIMEGQIQPLGVAVTRDQHLVVSDCKGKRVKIVSLETKTTIAEMGKGMFGWPCGVAVNSKGQIVVSDVFNDCVLIFSPDGKKLKSFGSSGGRHDQLRNPYHLAVDSVDRIYVSDSSNGCIKVFDTSGNLQFTSSEMVRHFSIAQDVVSERKSSNRKLRNPRGVAVDEFGNFFVADEQSRVSMFDSSGRFCRHLLTEEDSLKSPESLSYCNMRQDGLLLLTEWSPSNYSVKMFSLYQNM